MSRFNFRLRMLFIRQVICQVAFISCWIQYFGIPLGWFWTCDYWESKRLSPNVFESQEMLKVCRPTLVALTFIMTKKRWRSERWKDLLQVRRLKSLLCSAKSILPYGKWAEQITSLCFVAGFREPSNLDVIKLVLADH